MENGDRVLFTRTTELVQRLQAARQDLYLGCRPDQLDRVAAKISHSWSAPLAVDRMSELN